MVFSSSFGREDSQVVVLTAGFDYMEAALLCDWLDTYLWWRCLVD